MPPWDIPELGTGLVAGAVATLLLVVVALAGRAARRPTPAAVGGAVVAAAAIAAIAPGGRVTPTVVVTVAGVGAGVAFAHRRAWGPGTTFVAVAAPAAALGFLTGIPGPAWLEPAVAVAAVGGAVTATRTERRWRATGLVPTMVAVTVAGVFLTVPDTEEAAALLGACLPLALLGWPVRRVVLGGPGTAALVAVVAWVAAVGGYGRPSSVVGALACLGLLVTLGVGSVPGSARRRRHRTPVAPANARPPSSEQPGRWRGWSGSAAVLAAHGLVVLAASRVAGLSPTVPEAVVVALAAGAAAAVLGAHLRPGAGPEPARAPAPDAGHDGARRSA